MSNRLRPGASSRRTAFTLIELLVVMGVIAIVGSIVIVAFAGLARQARLSSGTNAVLAALGEARAQAMKNNRLVLVTFVPRLRDGGDRQVIEIVLARWTGDTFIYDGMTNPRPAGGTTREIVDRFETIPGVPVRQLPRGIKVAGPLYAASADTADLGAEANAIGDRDSYWATQAQLPLIDQNDFGAAGNEAPGRFIAVMFSPDGSVVDSNPQSDANLAFVDFGNDDDLFPRQDFLGGSYDSASPPTVDFISLGLHHWDRDEPLVTFAPFLSVYDDEQARNFYVGSDPLASNPWTDPVQRDRDLRQYVTENANRIHFNSYTGVAMR